MHACMCLSTRLLTTTSCEMKTYVLQILRMTILCLYMACVINIYLKIMNLNRGVGIDHCHKKEENKVEIMHMPALPNLSYA